MKLYVAIKYVNFQKGSSNKSIRPCKEDRLFFCTIVSITAAQLNRWTSVHQLKWKSACLLLKPRKAALGELTVISHLNFVS